MSIVTLLGFLLSGILFGACGMYAMLHDYMKQPNAKEKLMQAEELRDTHYRLASWRDEAVDLHRQLLKKGGSHKCTLCKPRVDRATLNRP